MSIQFGKQTSILGLAFEGGNLSAVEIKRTEEGPIVKNSLRETLSQDLVTGNPELAGAEIKRLLQNAGIRERYCVACIPLSWAYLIQLELPAGLSDADRESYIRLRAERDLPFSLEDLNLSISACRDSEGKEHVIVAAVSNHYIEVLQKILKSAGLRPRSFPLGIASLLTSGNARNGMSFMVHQEGIDIGIALDGAAAWIRSLPGSVYIEKDGVSVDSNQLVRELRIMLAKLPEALRSVDRLVHVYGNVLPEAIFTEKLQKPLSRLGLEVKRERSLSPGEEPGALVTPYAYSSGSAYLEGHKKAFEFLPPAIGRIKKIMGRVSARSILWLAGAVAALCLIIAVTFLVQSRRLNGLEKKWARMSPGVEKAESFQDKLRKYRSWHNDSIESLAILKSITQAFPEEGVVWARSLQMRGMNEIQLSGEAKNNKTWLDTIERMRRIKDIQEMKILQVREGDGPLQFSIKFKWEADKGGI